MFYFLTGTTQSQGNPYGGIITIVMLVAMVALFYFLMYRPQKKQEKEAKNMRDNLQVGDEVTTIGGIIGKVVSIKEETFLLETGRDKVRIRFLKSAVKSVDVRAEDAK
ncbi:MAG: preprotein translocase subunit YajC [Clostridia bacterium]|nr:preprotein translocase subunit YajC [Clostridia bacterium]